MNNDLILVGGGGHCRSCIDVIEREGKYKIAGIIDRPSKVGQEVLGYKIIGTDKDFPSLVHRYRYFLITIGQINSPALREKLYQQLLEMGAVFPRIISPLAYISEYAHIDNGTIVMHHAVINVGASIGYNCIINTNAIIEHDVKIGNHCHISTGAVLNGEVQLGQGTFVGSNSVCREGVKIGDYCLVGMGVRVLKNFEDYHKIL